MLTRADCLGRLATVTVGRVGLSWRALPLILPVHFRLVDDATLVLQARRGTTLHRATDGTVVAFEAEGPAGTPEPTWSVVVRGVATHGPLPYASIGQPESDRIEIRVDDISGREMLDTSDPVGSLIVTAPLRS